MSWRYLAIGLALPWLFEASCSGPPATRGGFDSDNPSAKIYAIERAAHANDTSAIRDIIPELGSDDPAVRLVAIETLERMTGQTYGYHHYDPPLERRAAIARWVSALEKGEIPVRTQASAASVSQDVQDSTVESR